MPSAEFSAVGLRFLDARDQLLRLPDMVRRARHLGDRRHGDDLADFKDVDAEQLAVLAAGVAAETEKQKLEFVRAREIAALVDFLLNRFHVPSQKG